MQYLQCWLTFIGFFVFAALVLIIAYSRRVRCPLCMGEVNEIEKVVLLEPTDMHPGLEATKYKCQSCDFNFSRKRRLAKLGALTSGAYFYDYERRTSLLGPTEAVSNWRSSKDDFDAYFEGGESRGSGASASY